jgi:adenine specific DNA methylase Mod
MFVTVVFVPIAHSLGRSGTMNKLFFGDNLDVLREKVKDESVDLVYLDPPFNSDANYNVLFKQSGNPSQSQAEAFRDTWDWGDQAERAYDDIIRANGDVALVVSGLRKWLGQGGMMAYLAMMTTRLLELRRVLKPNGSLFLHCDPTASHYLKLILDAVFGVQSFTNEIIWQRTTPKGLAFSRFASTHDVIFFYRAGDRFTWNPQYKPYTDEYKKRYNLVDEKTGRLFQATSLLNPNRNRPNLTYEFGGHKKVWRWTEERMAQAERDGLIYFPTRGGVPREKRFIDEQEGVPITSVWTDIPAVNAVAQERLGYPTQKPVALLERVISAASQEGQTVLDPFCGCGTTVEAAEKLKRQWIGIDVTHYAVTLIEGRLRSIGASQGSYQVAGRPVDLAGARELARRDKHQFQWWAAWRLGARWYREEKKGADKGIDGRMMFKNGPFGDGLIIISVKGGDNVGVQMVRDLRGVIEREKAEMGVLISLAAPTGPMKTEAAAAGYVSKSAHGRLARLQIVTIEEILEGRLPKLPPLPQPDRFERTAPRKKFKDQMELLLPFAGDKIGPAKGDFVDPSIMAFG